MGPGEEGGSAADTEAGLRAQVAELERRLGAKLAEEGAQAEAPTDAAPVSSVVQEAYAAVLRELPELEQVNSARLGTLSEKQYVLQQGDGSKENPIYKRKYEVLGMTLNQQDMYMKAFRKAAKAAKASEAVKKMIDIVKNGGGGLNKKEVKAETEKLQRSDRLAVLFFRDIVPEVLDDPVADVVTGLIVTVGLVVMTLLFCVCLFPPIPPSSD